MEHCTPSASACWHCETGRLARLRPVQRVAASRPVCLGLGVKNHQIPHANSLNQESQSSSCRFRVQVPFGVLHGDEPKPILNSMWLRWPVRCEVTCTYPLEGAPATFECPADNARAPVLDRGRRRWEGGFWSWRRLELDKRKNRSFKPATMYQHISNDINMLFFVWLGSGI